MSPYLQLSSTSGEIENKEFRKKLVLNMINVKCKGKLLALQLTQLFFIKLSSLLITEFWPQMCGSAKQIFKSPKLEIRLN